MKVFKRSTIFAIVFSVLFIVSLKIPFDYYTNKSNVTKKIQTSLEKYIQVACNKTVEVSKLSYPSISFLLDMVTWRAELTGEFNEVIEGKITDDSVYFEDHLCSSEKNQTAYLDAQSNQFVKDVPVYTGRYQSPPIDFFKEFLMKIGYSAFLMLGVLIYVILWIIDFVKKRRKAE